MLSKQYPKGNICYRTLIVKSLCWRTLWFMTNLVEDTTSIKLFISGSGERTTVK